MILKKYQRYYNLSAKRLTAMCAAMCCAAALLTGCLGGSQQAQSTASVQPSQGAQPAAPSGKLREIREPYGFHCSAAQYCYNEPQLIYENVHYRSIIDMQAGKQLFVCDVPGCAHGIPTCGAKRDITDMDEMGPWLFTKDTVYWMEGGETKPISVFKSAPDGSGRQPLFTLEGAPVTYQTASGDEATEWSHKLGSGLAAYADDISLYFQICVAQAAPGTAIGFARHLEVVRADLATGQTTVIFKGEPDSESVNMVDYDQLVGCTENALLLDIVTPGGEESTGSLSGDVDGLRHRIVALPTAGAAEGEALPTLCEFSKGDCAAMWITNSMRYTVDKGLTRMEETNLATGEKRTVLEGLPGAQTSTQVYFAPYIDGKLFLSLSQMDTGESETYAVNLTDGSAQKIELTMAYQFGSQVQTITPVAEYGDDFLIPYEERSAPVTGVTQAGEPYTGETAYYLYALISKQDYYAGNPNYREVEMLPQ